MTAEVIVMNKTAVAMASDSAATVTAKVFNSAEKLFMLIPGKPVGLMIYNYAEFMQLPWETIVKRYRDSTTNNKELNTLKDYANEFISFLSDTNNGLYSKEQYEVTFASVVSHYLIEIVEQINNEIRKIFEETAKKISDKEISRVISKWINIYYQKWQTSDNQFSAEDTKIFKKEIRKYKEILKDIKESILGHALLSKEDDKKIDEFCYSLFYKEKITSFHTGLVFAGFGIEEEYPVCVEYVIEHYFCGKLKITNLRDVAINANRIGCIIPFAQQDVVRNFIDGIHPDYEEKINKELGKGIPLNIIKEIDSEIKTCRKEKRERIHEKLRKFQQDYQDNLINSVKKDFKAKHTDSILNTVAILPKDELAKMAESLVNITSFMRRVSMVVETVGGPIDVAVISKKDGFIWIKRKHYFDMLYNPLYNHSLNSRG